VSQGRLAVLGAVTECTHALPADRLWCEILPLLGSFAPGEIGMASEITAKE